MSLNTLKNQDISADLALQEQELSIVFSDPAYVRAEEVVVDIDRSVGVIFCETYHYINILPQYIDIVDLIDSKEACLSASLPDGNVFRLKTKLSILT